MTIILAIIATNLISISNSQRQIAKMSKYAEACIRYELVLSNMKEDHTNMKNKVGKLVGIAPERVNWFCGRLHSAGRGT